METVAVLVLNYKRQANIKDIILPSLVNNPLVSTIIIGHGLRETVFGVDHSLEDGEIVRDGKVLHIGDFKANDEFCCWRRWNLIKKLKNIGILKEQYIHSQDDDLVFDNSTISNLLNAYKEGKGILLSATPSRNIDNGKYIFKNIKGKCNITLGQSIFTRVDIICNAVERADTLKIPNDILKQDDISISFLSLDNLLYYKEPKHYSVESKHNSLKSNNALSSHPDHAKRRNEAVKYFLPNKISYNIGILVYNNTDNLGDWYQTAAQLYIWWCYFKKPNLFIDFLKRTINESKMGGYDISWVNRDMLSKTKQPSNNKKILTICNAWWMLSYNSKLDFPPPDWIIPIYISMHINNPAILNANGVKHLKLYEPIGCRDLSTVDLLKKYNINAYFSGCLTMVLDLKDPRLGFTVSNNYTNKRIEIDIPQIISLNDSIQLTQVGFRDDGDLNYIIKSVQSTYDLIRATSIKTIRLHVWLPLISNNIPCILINRKTSQVFKEGDIDDRSMPPINRFSGLINLSNSSTFNKFKITLKEDLIKKITYYLVF